MEIITFSNSWDDFEKSLDALGPNQMTEKGRAFEELTRLHLLTDPTFSTKLADIWHHSEVPQSVVDELGLQRPEIGVDLVARARNGTYWAVQCKFHQDRTKNVTYNELKTFFSITERRGTYERLSHRLICTSANGVSSKVTKAHPEKLGFLTSAEFSILAQEQFDAFRTLLSGERPTICPATPREHQRKAVEAAAKYFSGAENSRGKLIHPCGSGKSLIAYWIAETLGAKTVLIAVPSLALVRQTLGTWTREAVANGIDMEWMIVCSDEDVSTTDDPVMRNVDLGIEVDTDHDVIANFLSEPSSSIKVLVATYQSGVAVSEGARKAGVSFDLGIFDEAHKTVGYADKPFAHLLYDNNVRVDKRIFMTATERHYRGNSEDILSMDDKQIYGNTFDELSFKAALEQIPPILSDYKIISTTITKSEIERLITDDRYVRSDGKEWSIEGDASTFAALIALRKAIKEHGIKHVVSFHRSILRSRQFESLNMEAVKADPSLGHLASFHVSGKQSMGVRAATLERFVSTTPSLITNARCLTEGVDVPAIDEVVPENRTVG